MRILIENNLDREFLFIIRSAELKLHNDISEKFKEFFRGQPEYFGSIEEVQDFIKELSDWEIERNLKIS